MSLNESGKALIEVKLAGIAEGVHNHSSYKAKAARVIKWVR